jgi:RND family efflux transporter MFP subunit
MLAMRRMLLILAAALVLGATMYYWARWDHPAASRSAALSVVRPEKKQIDANVLATGTIRLRVGAQVRVGAQISGIVKKLNAGVGTHLRQGDIIAEIDTRAIDAQVAQARAQVAEDEVAVGKAERDLARGHDLLTSGLLPRQQQEDLQWAANAARAKLAKSRADLGAAEVNLSYSTISAPISGTIASVATQEGETVASSFSTPTFVTIIEDDALELIAMVDEADIANVKPRERGTFTVEAYPSRELSGLVQRINPTGTILSGVVNYEVVISIGKGTSFLKPDMTANVAIRTAQRPALVLPGAAIHGTGEERFVYVETDRGAVKRSVTIGSREGAFTEIKKGLSSEDRIVLGEISRDEEKGPTP